MELVIYTDGSCNKNGKKDAKGGVGVFFGDNDTRNISWSYPKCHKYIFDEHKEDLGICTNNKTELLAILLALKGCENEIINGKFIHIKSDSNYSINCVSKWHFKWRKNNWKLSTGGDVNNKFLITTISDFIGKYPDKIKFSHTRSHTKKPNTDDPLYKDWYGNFNADKLADYLLLN